MRAVIIDEDANAIAELSYFLRDYEIEITGTYLSPLEALQRIMVDRPDIVFTDIDMPEMSGIDLAIKIQSLLYDVIIIFVTAHSQFAVEAFRAHPLDYVLKPINSTIFENTMVYVLKQYELIRLKRIKILQPAKFTISCFGQLEIKNEKQEVMKFATQKSKDMFSYILCNADRINYRDEIIALLFSSNDQANALNNYYVTLCRLRNSLAKFGFDSEMFQIKKNCSLYIANGICDFIDFSRFIKNSSIINSDNISMAEGFVEQYNGELFTDFDSEWTNEARDFIEIKMEDLMFKIAFYYKDIDHLKQEKILQKLIDINPLSTQGYESLLDLYLKLNQKSKYRNTYKKYREVMENELNLDLDGRYMKNY
jgi:two-component system, LytTR family, response regulator